MELLRLWFGLSKPIDRRTYLVHGAALMALKYAVDTLAVRLVAGRFWTPLDYLNPALGEREHALGPAPAWLLVAMAVWAAPFLWIGVSMSLRRLLDAGGSPWWCLFFFLPLVNWLFIGALAVLPSAPRPQREPEQAESGDRLRAVLFGIGGSLAVGAISFALHVLLLKQYSSTVFLGTPFTMGAVAGWVYNRREARPARASAGVGALSVAIAAGAILLFALEGAICVGMALPLVMGLGALGAVMGRFIAIESRASLTTAGLLLLLMPAAGFAEARLSPAPLREVLSSIEIDAPP